MVTVKLLRTIGVLEEEYGRIRFDGQQFYYDGLTCFFINDLKRGVMGADHKWYRPEHGIQFLQNLKNRFADNILQATDVIGE